MTVSQLCRQWFLIGSVWTSLTAVLLVGLFITYEPTANISVVYNTKKSDIAYVQEELPLRIAGMMISATDNKLRDSLPSALFSSPEATTTEDHASYFLSVATENTDQLTSPERAFACRQSCEDISLIFYLAYPDGLRIKEQHAKNGKLYAKREELNTSGACNTRFIIRFEDTLDTDTQLTDFDYNDVVLEVERMGNKLTVRPVYSEAVQDVQVGVSVYRQGEFDRDVTIFTSLIDQLKKETGRPGEGTVIANITPTFPKSCQVCTFACQDTEILFSTGDTVRTERSTYARLDQCVAYERIAFIDDFTAETIGVIEMRRVGRHISFVPTMFGSSTEPFPVTIQVSYRDEAVETYNLYDDLRQAVINEQATPGNGNRIISTSRNVPPLQCLTLYTSSCTPSCQDMDISLLLVDALGNELVEGTVVQNQAVSEREEFLWKSACEHSYLVKFDDPLSSITGYQDVWVAVERTPTGITVLPSRYESSRDYRLLLLLTNDTGQQTTHLIAPSVSQWTKPGVAAETFSFHLNLLSNVQCKEGISWQ